MSACSCGSGRFMTLFAKCNDNCTLILDGFEVVSYPPRNLNISDVFGDYIDFKVCADCGKIEGNWPLPKNALENAVNSE